MYPGKLCNLPMGLRNGKLRNRQITASSSWDKFHAPYLARLRKGKAGRFVAGWAAGVNNHDQWLQIDLARPSKIVRCSTQGRADVDQWVTSYWVSYSIDSLHFAFYTGGGSSYKVSLSVGYKYLRCLRFFSFEISVTQSLPRIRKNKIKLWKI